MTSLNHNHLPNTPSPNAITLHIRASTYEFARRQGLQTFSLQQHLQNIHKDKDPFGKWNISPQSLKCILLAHLSFQLINVLTFMKPKDIRGMYSSLLIIQRKSLRLREAVTDQDPTDEVSHS